MNGNPHSRKAVEPAAYKLRPISQLDLPLEDRHRLVSALRDDRNQAVAEICQELISRGRAPVELYFHAGLRRMRQGLLEQAHAMLSEAVRLEPGFGIAWQYLADVADGMGDSSEALNHLLRAVRVDPSDSIAWAKIGLILDHHGHSEEALTALLQAVAHYPNEKGFRRMLMEKIGDHSF